MDIEPIIYKLENRSIKSRNPFLNNHLMFYRAFKSFHKHYKLGRGCVYAFDSPINSEVLGYLTGIFYWIFHKGLNQYNHLIKWQLLLLDEKIL